MCGIAGFFNAKENYVSRPEYWSKILDEMNCSLSHRGDDGFGAYLSETVGFTHAHFCSRDGIPGKQPVICRKNEGEYAIIYDGELYNAGELASDLQNLGYELSTASDTEVILYAYMQYGAAFVQKLNGVFAFVIWDNVKKELLLYRDRVGVKPLFYVWESGRLLFASEQKALFCFPGFRPRLTMDGMREILAVGPAHTAGNGIFEQVKEVLPGHYLIFHQDTVSDFTYWDLFRKEHTDSYKETLEKVSFLLHDAVIRQTVSDDPVCAFLSGGIDSSIVTSIASRYMKEHDETIHTFSFDFKDNDIYFQSNSFQPERDLPYVKIMLQHCETHHTYLECDESSLFHALFQAVDARDLPGMTDIDSSLLYFCSLVKKYNKVALTGECSDEIFGGYPWFYRKELMSRDGFPWSFDLSARTSFLKDAFVEEMDLSDYSRDCYLTSMNRAPHLAGETAEERRRYDIAYLNIKWFMQTLLDRMDRTGMYSGLKARVPFADHRIIEYVYNVPWDMKYRNDTEKSLLRDACKDLLPVELLHRKKSPYPKTYHPGYEKLLVEQMKHILDQPNAPIKAFIDRKKLENFLEAPTQYGKPWFGQLMAGPQLLAYFIQINYWMEKYHLSL